MSTKLNFLIVCKLIGTFALEELQNGIAYIFQETYSKASGQLELWPCECEWRQWLFVCCSIWSIWFISWLQLCTEWSDHWVVFWQHGWISQWLSATQYANWTQAMLFSAFRNVGSVILGGNSQVSLPEVTYALLCSVLSQYEVKIDLFLWYWIMLLGHCFSYL